MKYFYNWLVFFVCGPYLPEIAAIFYITLPVWHKSADFEVQNYIENNLSVYMIELIIRWLKKFVYIVILSFRLPLVKPISMPGQWQNRFFY